ncbi:ATP-binding protein [Ideonella sp. A 288]|uniref:ATP-binding protein n=1 Tax=Ideonella sp. A 288 TaxID=1962181 RepID=UPI000B4AF30B|nr:ATP-binding protein [Ideonella sp. A 288]
MGDPSDSDIQARREALSFGLSQARLTVATMLLVVGVVSWMGWRAGLAPWSAAFVGMGLLSAVWRFWVIRASGDALQLDPAALRRAERRVEANMLYSGAMWTFANVTIYPGLAGEAAALYVIILVANVSFAAFFMSAVGHGFALMVVPTMGSAFLVCLSIGTFESRLMAGLILVFVVVMVRATNRFRKITLLASRRGHEMRQTNEALRHAMADAEVAAQAKTRFLATMSHELRTPMNGLLGALELLGRASLPPPQRRLLDIARSSGGGLLAVLNDVLDYAKIEADALSLHAAPTSLRAVVDSVVGLFMAPAHAKGLVLRAEMAPEVPAWVMADGQRLRQVLLNIVGNAIKFTEQGEVVVRIDAQAQGLRFEVRDTGIGIAPQAQAELFQPFRQVDERSSRSHGGTGLGLAISQRLVQAMGGHIDVHSAAGQGARFAFTLALPATHDPQPVAPAPAAAAPSLSGRVLLVDDNPVNRCLVVELLGVLGVDVVEAEDGAQALVRLRTQPFDLVLMDCQMPVLDGCDATRQWRALEAAQGRARLPVVAVTANVMADDAERARASGMDDLLAKPFTFEQLQATVARWLPRPVAQTAGQAGD